jgi:copper transport protein
MSRAVVVTTVALFAALAAAPPAFAHSNLASSDPAGGAELAKAPNEVRMTFTEPPDPGLSKVVVLNAAGQEIQAGPAVAGTAPRSLVVALSRDLPDGVYTVSWQVVSTADGHLTANAFAFGVGVAAGAVAAPTAQSTPSPSVLSVAGKVALYAGIVLAIGVVFVGLWVAGTSLPGRRWLSLAAGVLMLAGAVAMALAERSTVGVSLRALLSSDAGERYLWLLVAGIVALVCSVAAASTRSWATLALLGAAGAAAALVRAIGGHAAAASPAWPQELLQTVHIVAVGVWIGGFVPVLLLLRASRGDRPPVDRVRRYSRVAGWAVLVVIATGLVRATDEAGGLGHVLDMLFDTSYGTALLIKIALVIGIIALGWLNRRRSIPRLESGDRFLARVMGVEAVAALTVLGVTATLTGLNPQPPPAAHPAHPVRVSATGNDFATTMRVSLTATPGAPGPNGFEARVTNFDTGDPLQATAVTLDFEPVGRPGVQNSQLDLREMGSGVWAGDGTQLSLAGVWDVRTLVQTGARATEVQLTLVTRAPGGQTTSVATSGELRIVTITLGGGVQLQSYLDPDAPGANDVHVTAFDRGGDELPLAGLLVVATPEGGEPMALDATRLSAGHFSADADLDAGAWRFDLVATAKDGTVLQGWFDQTIG